MIVQVIHLCILSWGVSYGTPLSIRKGTLAKRKNRESQKRYKWQAAKIKEGHRKNRGQKPTTLTKGVYLIHQSHYITSICCERATMKKMTPPFSTLLRGVGDSVEYIITQ